MSEKLTSEQVREAIEKRFDFDVWVPAERWQAITDELNAERHVETCENMSVDETKQFYCSECECTVDTPLLWGVVNFCPDCGCKVVDNAD